MSLVRGTESVMCPRSVGPVKAPEHELHDRINNAAYAAAERDAEGELTPAADRQHTAVAYGPDPADHNTYGMRAYVANAQGLADGFGPVTVRVAWLHCQVCGLILPGQYVTAAEERGAWRPG